MEALTICRKKRNFRVFQVTHIQAGAFRKINCSLKLTVFWIFFRPMQICGELNLVSEIWGWGFFSSLHLAILRVLKSFIFSYLGRCPSELKISSPDLPSLSHTPLPVFLHNTVLRFKKCVCWVNMKLTVSVQQRSKNMASLSLFTNCSSAL